MEEGREAVSDPVKSAVVLAGASTADPPATRKPLTARQRQILVFVGDHTTRRGYPPTLREIGARFGIESTNGVNAHLSAIERRGFITRDDMKSRSTKITSAGWVEIGSQSGEAIEADCQAEAMIRRLEAENAELRHQLEIREASTASIDEAIALLLTRRAVVEAIKKAVRS